MHVLHCYLPCGLRVNYNGADRESLPDRLLVERSGDWSDWASFCASILLIRFVRHSRRSGESPLTLASTMNISLHRLWFSHATTLNISLHRLWFSQKVDVMISVFTRFIIRKNHRRPIDPKLSIWNPWSCIHAPLHDWLECLLKQILVWHGELHEQDLLEVFIPSSDQVECWLSTADLPCLSVPEAILRECYRVILLSSSENPLKYWAIRTVLLRLSDLIFDFSEFVGKHLLSHRIFLHRLSHIAFFHRPTKATCTFWWHECLSEHCCNNMI